MNTAAERLQQLVPALYRSRDLVTPGQPLGRLLGLLGGELDQLRGAIRALADDHFVERASPEALLLLAELYGARLLGKDTRVNRGVVARSIAWRRRRGTLAVLEEVLALTSGWSVEVDEAHRSLAYTQELGRLAPLRGRSAILWDPIAIADPLSRNAPSVALPARGAAVPPLTVARDHDETLDQALRRMGRADAGRHAASPRSLDLAGWARPGNAVIRSARLSALEIEAVQPGPPVSVTVADGGSDLVGFRLDPLDRDQPLVWLQPLERPDTLPTLTAIHEPAAEPDQEPATAPRRGATLLTPTALAADGDLAEAQGAIEIQLDGVQLLGPALPPPPRAALPFKPVGARPLLRLADPLRPDPADDWGIKLIAHQAVGDQVIAAVSASRGQTSRLELSDRANTELAGATLRLRLRRYAGSGRARAANGSWSALGDGSRLGPPLGNTVALPDVGGPTLYRPELHQAATLLRLARRPPGAATWEAVTLNAEVPAAEPGALLAAADGDLMLVIPERDANAALVAMGLYRLQLAAATATATREVAATALRPPPRTGASLCIHNGRLYLFGGQSSTASGAGGILDELWSIAIDGSEPDWTPQPLRNPQQRRDATLLSTPTGLLLIGGEASPGALNPECWLLDPAAPRPRWREHPALPIAAGLPGTLIAQHDGNAGEALVWADHTRPQLFRLAAGSDAWVAGQREQDAPNPPAPGEGLFDGQRYCVVGPPPLPACEVILSLGGYSTLVQLPALDQVPAALDAGETLLADDAQNPGLPTNAYASFQLATDGSTWLVDADADPGALHTRHGGVLHAALGARLADRPRIGIPQRLARHFFHLRQRSLGTWERPYAPPHGDLVGLDPRLGRVLLPRNLQPGRITVSYRVGRASALGAGMLPPDRALPTHWTEPEAPAPTPPDLRPHSRAGGPGEPGAPRFDAWVDPPRAGNLINSGTTPVTVFGDIESALAATAADTQQAAIGLLRSARVPAARLTELPDGDLSIVATDFGGTPFIAADPAGDPTQRSSLALHPDHAGSPRSAIWLAGLWLAGRLDLAMARGQVDLRWCTIGRPGELSIRLPGGGHQGLLTRRTVPPATLELRLYGCQLGQLRVPPWVRVVAAGCTFDAGARDRTAIQALGADLRLRHCTVNGAVEAGELRASSCAFAGALRIDRRDRGWLRHSLLPGAEQAPRRYRCIDSEVALLSTSATHPGYLVLADNNGEAALNAGELGRRPGAHAERQGRLRELHERSEDYLPIGMRAHHIDRSTQDLNRMARRQRRQP